MLAGPLSSGVVVKAIINTSLSLSLFLPPSLSLFLCRARLLRLWSKMSFYPINLAASVLPNVALALRQYLSTRREAQLAKEDPEKEPALEHDKPASSSYTDPRWSTVRKLYLLVYGLAVTADWLQVCHHRRKARLIYAAATD